MQRGQRNVPVYLREQQQAEEKAQEKLLLLKEQQRDKRYMDEEQVCVKVHFITVSLQLISCISVYLKGIYSVYNFYVIYGICFLNQLFVSCCNEQNIFPGINKV